MLDPKGPRPLEPTAIIAGYRIEEPIARGGMGVVYRATQLALERPVALKLIAPERSQDAEFRERFKSESHLAALIEHPNVVPVYEAGEDDGLLFIAMRLVDGTDLAQLLVRLRALEPARAVRLIAQLAGALDAAHTRGLVHRDVKPANVLIRLDEPEHAYLTDFGVATHIRGGAGLTQAGQRIGTLAYVAPEQIRGDAVDGSADIYALTGVLHHCLTGQAPFPRESDAATLWAHVNSPPPAPSQLVAGIPETLDEVIARGMAKEPAARFASAADLARAGARALGMGESDMPAAPDSESPRRAQSPASSPSAPTLPSS